MSSCRFGKPKEIHRKLNDKMLEKLEMDYILWIRKAVQEFIMFQTDIDLIIRRVGEYQKRWVR